MSANSRINTKKIASAALAGMMALGTVPAAAIAEEATSVETQSVSEVEDFQATGTKVTKATINGTEADGSSVTANGETKTIVPTEITTAGGTVITLTANTDGNYTGSDGWTYTVSGDTASKTVGTHTYSVTGTKDGESKTQSFTWTITAGSLSGVTAYNGDDTSDTTFTYNGGNQDVHFLLNGKTLTEGTDYTVKYVVNGQAVSTGSDTLVNAGSYTAVLTGEGEYDGVTAEVPITVNKLDLSSASVKIADTSSDTAPTLTDVEVNGTKLTADAKYTLTFKSGTTASGSTSVYGQDGSYTYTLTSTDTANITGSKDVTFNKVDTVLASDAVTWNNSTSVNLDDASPAYFDASKVVVKNGNDTLPTSSYTLSYEKWDGTNWVTASASDLRSAGTYRVSVNVNASALNYQYGGIDGYLTVTVGHTTNTASAYVSYKGNLVGTGTTTGSIEADYDGSNVADDVTVAVRTSTGATLTAGTDYEVVYYNADGEEVDSITDAGTYQIRVNLLNGWKYSDGSTTDVTTVTVDPEAVYAQVSYDGQLNYGSGHFFNHTGSAITPTIEFFTKDTDGDYVMNASGRIVEADSSTSSTATRYSKVDVPASAYTVTYKNSSNQTVSSIVDNGTYTVSIADAHSGDDADNYTVATTGDSSITVSDQRRFADVANDEWYAQVISDAAEAGYMNGYGNNFFGPEDTFTRGQAACVLYNYAKKTAGVSTSTDGASSSFSDVQDSEEYYYDAVTWAAHTGVVNGYGDGTFKPDQPVTREEFAAMLANYAQKVGNYTAASDSVLDSFADASNVDDWATSSVAWAVANKVMGNGGFINPTANITRAETAAMIINFANAMK